MRLAELTAAEWIDVCIGCLAKLMIAGMIIFGAFAGGGTPLRPSVPVQPRNQMATLTHSLRFGDWRYTSGPKLYFFTGNDGPSGDIARHLEFSHFFMRPRQAPRTSGMFRHALEKRPWLSGLS